MEGLWAAERYIVAACKDIARQARRANTDLMAEVCSHGRTGAGGAWRALALTCYQPQYWWLSWQATHSALGLPAWLMYSC